MSLMNNELAAPIRCIYAQFGHDDMTDAGDDHGSYTFTAANGKVPPNCLVLGWKAVITEGFTSTLDTSTAVMKVGSSIDGSEWSTTATGSCKAAATISSATVIATANTTAETAPVVTIVEDSDFTSIFGGTGECTVYVYYMQL